MENDVKYKIALERANEAVKKGFVSQDLVDEIFGAESEDERIRKELIELVRETINEPNRGGITMNKEEKYIAWLEKQKEQNKELSKFELKTPEWVFELKPPEWVCRGWDDEYMINTVIGRYSLHAEVAKKRGDTHDYNLSKSMENWLRNVVKPLILEKQKESLHIEKTCKENADSFTDADERIRKEILDCFQSMKAQGCFPSRHKEQYTTWIAWLKKQEEYPTNEEMLRTLRCEYEKGVADTIAKYEQEEQKPILEAFGFKVGDKVRLKDGDGRTHIIKSFEETEGIHGPNFYHVVFEDDAASDYIIPGKEYIDGYFTHMEKIEEKEQKPDYTDEYKKCLENQDYFIKNYITVKQKQEWSEEDEKMRKRAICACKFTSDKLLGSEHYEEAACWLKSLPVGFIVNPHYNQDMVNLLVGELQQIAKDNNVPGLYDGEINWLKSLRPQPKYEWSEKEKGILLECVSALQNSSHWLLASELLFLRPQPKQEWSEEDEDKLNHILEIVHIASGSEASVNEKEELEFWLKSLKNRGNSQKSNTNSLSWSEEEANKAAEDYADEFPGMTHENDGSTIEDYDKPYNDFLAGVLWAKHHGIFQNGNSPWKPSEEQMKHLERCFSHGHTSQLPNQHVLESLYHDLQKLL